MYFNHERKREREREHARGGGEHNGGRTQRENMRARMSALVRKDRPVGREAGNYVEKREEEGQEEEKPGLGREVHSLLPASSLPPPILPTAEDSGGRLR